ncbi:MAG: hypothetical protein LBP53_01680 [Candidatus Peribacteria bacterium]|jgi:hypothetical protein|nr:hypothetical protein [Candidatus Peribacteria bacterium]
MLDDDLLFNFSYSNILFGQQYIESRFFDFFVILNIIEYTVVLFTLCMKEMDTFNACYGNEDTYREWKFSEWEKNDFKNFMKRYLNNAITYSLEHPSKENTTIILLLKNIVLRIKDVDISLNSDFISFCEEILSNTTRISVLFYRIMQYLDGKNLDGKKYLENNKHRLSEIKPQRYLQEKFVEDTSSPLYLPQYSLDRQNNGYRLLIYTFLRYLSKNVTMYHTMKETYDYNLQLSQNIRYIYEELDQIQQQTEKELLRDFIENQPYRVVA